MCCFHLPELFEGESDCMDERERGQFSIFGAVEEKVCTDFGGEGRLPLQVANVSKVPVGRSLGGYEENLEKLRGGAVSGLYTGGAQEMQKKHG